MSIVIVDYDAGNLRSVQKAFERVGAEAIYSRDAALISSADKLVLPGVGAFPECMANLKKFGLLNLVKDFIGSGKPFLGICVGFQLLFEQSEEFGHSEGLGVFKGKCVKFTPAQKSVKVPHMGWNQVIYQNENRLFDGITEGSDFYFVHSYYPVPQDASIITGATTYGPTFASAIESGNIYGTQFHPEKSQSVGLKVLENFSRITS